MELSAFGKRLNGLRTDRGLSQDELAKIIGVSRSSVSMYEIGRNWPDFEVLDAIADYFDVNVDYLLGFSDVNEGYPRHGDAALVRRMTAYASKIMAAYDKASPDTQAAVRAILHVED